MYLYDVLKTPGKEVIVEYVEKKIEKLGHPLLDRLRLFVLDQ